MLGTYDLILFDFDDTLVDFPLAQTAALAAVGRHFGRGVGPEALAAFHAINAELWAAHDLGTLSLDHVLRHRFERFLPLLELAEADRDADRANTAFLEGLAEAATPFPGAVELVRRVAAAKPVGIVTNGHGATQRKRLRHAGFGDIPLFVVVSGEVGASKPSRRIFEAAYEMSGLAPGARTVMIGDNLKADVAGALAAGFDAFWVNAEGKPAPADVKPSFVVRSVSELTFP